MSFRIFVQIRDRLLTGGFAANLIGVGCVNVSTKSKHSHTPPGKGFCGAVAPQIPMCMKLSSVPLCQAGDWGLQNHMRQRNGYSTALSPSPQPLSHPGRGASGTPSPMRMKLSSVPLCQAGDWGLQTICVNVTGIPPRFHPLPNPSPIQGEGLPAPLPPCA